MNMADLSSTIEPKSDQLNADDLIAGPRTITITKVSKVKGEQPIIINFEDDHGKPYKPGLSMRRVLVRVWGKNSANYIGKAVTLVLDPTVKWGGVAVGGIRISHMSHIDDEITMPLTATRGVRKPFTVQPLRTEKRSAPPSPPLRGAGRGGDDEHHPPSSSPLLDDDFDGDAIEPPLASATEDEWRAYGKLVRAELEAAPTTIAMRAIAHANQTNIDLCPSEKLRAWIREPRGE